MAEQTDLNQGLKPSVVEFVIPGDPESDIPDETVAIGRFCFMKSMMLIECLAELAEKVDVASVFTADDIKLDMLLDKLPVLMKVARPIVTRALAVTLIKNRALEDADRGEGSIEGLIKEKSHTVAYRLDLDKATELLTIAVERVGVQNVKRNFPLLLAAIQAS